MVSLDGKKFITQNFVIYTKMGVSASDILNPIEQIMPAITPMISIIDPEVGAGLNAGLLAEKGIRKAIDNPSGQNIGNVIDNGHKTWEAANGRPPPAVAAPPMTVANPQTGYWDPNMVNARPPLPPVSLQPQLNIMPSASPNNVAAQVLERAKTKRSR